MQTQTRRDYMSYELRAAIEGAIEEWDGCTWTHDRHDGDDTIFADDVYRDGVRVGSVWVRSSDEDAEPDYTPVLCAGGSDGDPRDGYPQCSVCDRVRADAAKAQQHGREALEALDRRDISAARSAVEEASFLEAQYGDDPTWGHVIDLVEEEVRREQNRDEARRQELKRITPR